MKQVKTTYYCDLCRRETPESSLYSVNLPMWSDVSDDDGHSCSPYIFSERIDLCPDCLRSVAVVHRGFHGETYAKREPKQDAKIYLRSLREDA